MTTTIASARAREPLAPLADRELWTVATYLNMNQRARAMALAEYRANNSAESAERVELAVKRGGV